MAAEQHRGKVAPVLGLVTEQLAPCCAGPAPVPRSARGAPAQRCVLAGRAPAGVVPVGRGQGLVKEQLAPCCAGPAPVPRSVRGAPAQRCVLAGQAPAGVEPVGLALPVAGQAEPAAGLPALPAAAVPAWA